MLCLKCNVDENDSKLLTNCDSCSRSIHKLICSGLNASEIKVIDLKGRRTLKFLCEDCQSGLLHVPKILKAIDDLRAELSVLKSDIAKNLSTNDSTKTSSSSSDEVFSELQDRQSRANSLMVFNLPEQDKDTEDVKSLFNVVMRVQVQPKSVTRIGKPNKNGFRSLKILLHNKDDVHTLIQSRSKLKGKKVYINRDLTKMQRETEISIRNEYRQRVENGEQNIQIKYHQDIPRIVSKN